MAPSTRQVIAFHEIGFVAIPTSPHPAALMLAQSLGQQWREFRFPLPDRFMGKPHAAVEKHLGQVPQTAFVAYPPEHDQTDDIRRILQTIEERAGPFIQAVAAGPAPKPAVASSGWSRTFGGSPTTRSAGRSSSFSFHR